METNHSTFILLPCPDLRCEQSFSSQAGMILHARAKHLLELPGAYSCQAPECGQTFYTFSGLELHHRTSHAISMFLNCTDSRCDETFTEPRDLQRHHLKAHPHASLRLQCGIEGCGKSYQRADALHNHYQTIHAPLPFSCLCIVPGCEKRYSSSFKRHICLEHPGFLATDNFDRCEHCDTFFPDENWCLLHLFNIHEQRHLLVLPPRPGTHISELDATLYTDNLRRHTDDLLGVSAPRRQAEALGDHPSSASHPRASAVDVPLQSSVEGRYQTPNSAEYATIMERNTSLLGKNISQEKLSLHEH